MTRRVILPGKWCGYGTMGDDCTKCPFGLLCVTHPCDELQHATIVRCAKQKRTTVHYLGQFPCEPAENVPCAVVLKMQFMTAPIAECLDCDILKRADAKRGSPFTG